MTSPTMIAMFQKTGVSAGTGEVVVAVEDPDDDPRQAEQHDDREEHAREPDGEMSVAERGHDPRRDHDEQRRQAAQPEQHEPEEARRDAPCALPLALDQELAEDGDERRRQRSVGDERAHGVRDQERDLERVDRADGAEVVARDDLADEAEDAREAGGEREDRRRPRQPPAAGRGLLVHGASIGTRSAVAGCPRVRSRTCPFGPVDRRSQRPEATILLPAASVASAGAPVCHAGVPKASLRGCCYHRPARVAGIFTPCRTSSSRRNASGPRPRSGSRTSATSRP